MSLGMCVLNQVIYDANIEERKERREKLKDYFKEDNKRRKH